jgi:cbb3-type cytochrome oxidase cytochrome c subunit
MENHQLQPKNWSPESYIKAYKFAAQAHQGHEFVALQLITQS